MVTRYLIIDTETTGLDPLKGGHRVIELACLEYLDSKPTGNVFNLTLNPEGKKSTSSAFKIHRIKNEDLIGQPTFKEVLDKFIKLATDAHIIAFNAPFDIKFLNSELVKAGHTSTLQDISSAISCAMELAKSKFNIGRISLDNACLRYGNDTSHRETHSALTDAKLCAQLYFKLIDNAEKPLKRTPQQKKHRETKAITIPRAFIDSASGIKTQLNFCKNPACKNFGVSAKNPTYDANGKLKRALGNNYRLTARRGSNDYVLTCKLCNQSTVMINNRCLVIETHRYRDVGKQVEPSCPNHDNPSLPYERRYYYIPESPEKRKGTRHSRGNCSNTNKGVYSYPEEYRFAGKTRPTKYVEHRIKQTATNGRKPVERIWVEERKGSQRVQCEGCQTKFSIKLDPQQRHYRRDINLPLFLDMMNKGIINRAEEKFGVTAKVIYDKLSFYYEQALAFEEYHNQNLPKALDGKSLSLSTDRQHYLSNWGDHNMPMPTAILNTSSADNDSGYIFAATVNFDFTTNDEYVKKEYREKKEFQKESYYSRYAQYVLDNEQANTQLIGANSDVQMQIPPKGLLVQQTYNILTHFKLLKEMLGSTQSINLFADNDAGFKMAICGVFHDWITSGKMNAFQVTVDRAGGHKLLDRSTTERIKNRLDEISQESPELTEKEKLNLLWQEEISTRVTKPGSRSEWIVSPNLKSRFSGLLPLMDIEKVDVGGLITLMDTASLHGVDNWFQIIRRHLNMLERPVTSGTNSRRWNAYAGYNPEWMTKLIEIKRIYFNYCMTDEKRLKKLNAGKMDIKPTSPAVRLGVTDRIYHANDILSFSYNEKMLSLYKNSN